MRIYICEPLILFLPFILTKNGFNLAGLLANDQRYTWSQGYELLEKFALKTHEKTFALTLLRKKRNLWLFRANQRKACGDFLIVDMSAKSKLNRQTYVIELKLRVPLIISSSKVNIQFTAYQEAIQEISSTTGIINPDCQPDLLYGDNQEVIEYFGCS